MKGLKVIFIAILLALPFAGQQTPDRCGVGVGPAVAPAPVDYGPPDCAWGYYPYYPYGCAPYGYFGLSWFVSGVFLGVGPGTDGAGVILLLRSWLLRTWVLRSRVLWPRWLQWPRRHNGHNGNGGHNGYAGGGYGGHSGYASARNGGRAAYGGAHGFMGDGSPSYGGGNHIAAGGGIRSGGFSGGGFHGGGGLGRGGGFHGGSGGGFRGGGGGGFHGGGGGHR